MKKVFAAILAGFIITVCIGYYSNRVQADISNSFVRFHVLANSDSSEDQLLKLKVRDRVIDEMNELFEHVDDIEATRRIITENIEDIEAIARDEISRNYKDYNVRVALGRFPFPTKKYGDVMLPAGNYEALRIVIGDGDGANWWCVLFPPLCFVDATHGTVPEDAKERLKNVLTDEEYEIITTASDESEVPVKIKFKVVELWQQSKIKMQEAFNR